MPVTAVASHAPEDVFWPGRATIKHYFSPDFVNEMIQ